MQVFGDGKGKAVHLGERDCSLQRRHQKVMEEAPSPAIDAKTRARIGRTCADAVAKIAYAGAGTIEFLYENGEFYFIEMNTRLQVEHPVTEAIYDVDLVQEQIRVAAGLPMSFTQADLEPAGHAIECRINAEKLPQFQPSPGRISTYYAPGGLGVRMDSAIFGGYTIPPYYDSLIGKLIVHARTRELALARLRRALSELVVDGIDTTTPLFDALLDEPDIQTGDYNIHWLEKWLAREEALTRCGTSCPRSPRRCSCRPMPRASSRWRRRRRPTSSSGSIPRRRGVLPLDGLHVSRRLARSFLARRLRDPGGRRLRRRGRRLRRAAGDLDQRRDPAALPRAAPHGPRAFGGDLARRARSPAGSTAWRSAAPSSARACSAAAATPRSSR